MALFDLIFYIWIHNTYLYLYIYIYIHPYVCVCVCVFIRTGLFICCCSAVLLEYHIHAGHHTPACIIIIGGLDLGGMLSACLPGQGVCVLSSQGIEHNYQVHVLYSISPRTWTHKCCKSLYNIIWGSLFRTHVILTLARVLGWFRAVAPATWYGGSAGSGGIGGIRGWVPKTQILWLYAVLERTWPSQKWGWIARSTNLVLF